MTDENQTLLDGAIKTDLARWAFKVMSHLSEQTGIAEYRSGDFLTHKQRKNQFERTVRIIELVTDIELRARAVKPRPISIPFLRTTDTLLADDRVEEQDILESAGPAVSPCEKCGREPEFGHDKMFTACNHWLYCPSQEHGMSFPRSSESEAQEQWNFENAKKGGGER